MYADKITGSMRLAIDETQRRRMIQIEYNTKHGITPTTVIKSKEAILMQTSAADSSRKARDYYIEEKPSIAADPVVQYMNKEQLQKLADKLKKDMEKAAKEMDFLEAARLRDEFFEIMDKLK